MSGCCGGKAAVRYMTPEEEHEFLYPMELQGEGATAYVPASEYLSLEVPEVPTSADRIRAEYRRQEALSLEKNASYGDSALHPIHVFSKLDGPEGIRARLDDKLARHKNAPGAMGEREIDDLIGYLVLLNIAMRQAHE
jgi:hypothetical protein